VDGSTSTNTILWPVRVTASALPIKELAGTSIFEPFGSFKASIAISSASVPLPTPTQ